MATAIKANSFNDRTSEFRYVADQICAFVGKYDLNIKGYHSAELPLFNALPAPKQIEIVRLLKMYLESLVATEAMGERLDNSVRSTWCALSSMGLMPPSDLFKHFSSAAAVEIYDLNSLQIWRNFECLRVCSYTLEEIYSLEWFNRYTRSEEISKSCFEAVGGLLAGTTPDILLPDMVEHLIEETCSVDRLVLKMEFVLFCRLKNREGKLVAFAAISTAKEVGKAPSIARVRPQLKVVPALESLDPSI